MFRILHDTNYDFIRWWKVMAAITIAFILLGLGSLAIKPPNYSIEFTGGTLMQLEFSKPPDVAEIRSSLDQAGIRGAEIQQFGTNREFTIRAQNPAQVAAQARGAENIAISIESVLKKKFGATELKVIRTEAVTGTVGQELKRGAIIAVLLSFLITLIYLSIRFEWRFATAAVIATSHDVFTTIAFLKLMHLEISLTVVAGLLTVLGYSLNDTIIVFDRVRENLRKGRKESLYETLNRSINETLPRSVLTHATAFAATMALLIFAGEIIRPFAWVMAFGIVTGTFSSIYVAAPVLLWIERKWPRKTGARQSSSTVTPTSRTRRSPATAAR
ncbi:MAG TPA: protein translocase subunit SecF [Gemmatimonadaceae bacterium]|nr:protein translocase subunit SecF [Gemmatimonadaceae bacterium]